MSPGVHVHVLMASGRLAGLDDWLSALATTVSRRVESCFELPEVDLVVRDAPSLAVPEVGIGGFTPDAHTVLISLDPDHAGFGSMTFEDEFMRCLAHELHHAARWLHPGYGTTLFEAMVTEGLADHFACSLGSLPPPPWSIALDENQTTALLKRAHGAWDEGGYEHAAWFFGRGQDIPRWTGYTLGWSIVAAHLATNAAETAASLVHENASPFRSAAVSILNHES